MITGSTMSNRNIGECAIYVTNAYKAYGQNQILNNFSMTVPRSCIYGLLGASGCGKTTLLSCILGSKELSSGDIYVLGVKIGRQTRVQGCRVGFMPQDIALVDEFTVKDTIFFFARILNMKDDLIFERFQTLKQLLDLPPDNRKVKNCSGGQKRRVSLVAAMIHNPELLILDEPTVGLDSVLRASIWDYLRKVAEEGTAVIITTHYIEEAKQAHKIGIMRGGELMAEASPERLLQLFNTDNLEDVFLALSSQQEQGQLNNIIEDEYMGASVNEVSPVFVTPVNYSIARNFYRITASALSLNKRRLKSLLFKNIIQLVWNPIGIAVAFILPIVVIISFMIAIGGDPKNLPIAIVNDENPNDCQNYKKQDTAILDPSSYCKFRDLSCRFLDDMQDPMMTFIANNNTEYAINEVRHGNAVGVIYISQNFSDAFTIRINSDNHSSEVMDFAKIDVWLDMSSHVIAESLRNRILVLSQNFLESALNDCNYLERYGRIPIQIHYENGGEGVSFVDFFLPGLLLSVTFQLGSTLTSILIITDRLEGIWERTTVAGVSSLEIFIAHFVTQFFLLLVQTIETIVLTFGIFHMHYSGEIWLIFFLVLMQGICGMSFGIFASIITDSHSAANSLIVAVYCTLLNTCGFVWPLEAQPDALKYLTLCLPFTRSITSLREVLTKGAGIMNIPVIEGLSSVLIWTLVFSVFSIILIKTKR